MDHLGKLWAEGLIFHCDLGREKYWLGMGGSVKEVAGDPGFQLEGLYREAVLAGQTFSG